MRYLFIVFCLVSFVAYGQEPAYTPMRLNYQFRGIKIDSLLLIPSFNDTTAANNSTMKNVAGAMIRTGNDFWMRNATTNAWLQNVNVGTGASPSIQFVDSVWRVAGKDSIFWRKGGTTNKIKDSVGRATLQTTLTNGDTAYNKLIWLKGLTGSIRIDNENQAPEGPSISVEDSAVNSSASSITPNELSVSNTKKLFGIGIVASDTPYLVILRTNGQNKHFVKNVQSIRSVEWDHYLPLDSGVLVNKVQNIKADTAGNIKLMEVVDSVDIINANYNITKPGFYTVYNNDDSYKLCFPNPANFPGSIIIVLNLDADPFGVNCGYDPLIKNGTNLNTINSNDFIQFISDGTNWWAGFLN